MQNGIVRGADETRNREMKNRRRGSGGRSMRVKKPRTRMSKNLRARLALRALDPQQDSVPDLSTKQFEFLSEALRTGVSRRDVLKAGAITAGGIAGRCAGHGIGRGAQARSEVAANRVAHLFIRFVVVRYRRSRYRDCGGQALLQVESHLAGKTQAAA